MICKHTLEEDSSITSIHYDLAIVTHGEEMHKHIILVVN